MFLKSPSYILGVCLIKQGWFTVSFIDLIKVEGEASPIILQAFESSESQQLSKTAG